MLLENLAYDDNQDLRQSLVFKDLTFKWKMLMVNTEKNNKQYYIISDNENVKKIRQAQRVTKKEYFS